MKEKYIDLSKKSDYKLHVMLFIFIACMNVICLLLTEELEAFGYRGWTFYFGSVLFFVFPELNIRARMIKIASGGVMGCLFSYLVIILYIGPLAHLGIWGLAIPIVLVLASVFLVGPFISLCFNVATFAYFTVALVNAEDAALNLGPNILWTIIGVIICDGGFSLIIKWNQRKARSK